MKRNKISRRHFIETAAIGLASSYATNAVADDRTAAPQKAAGRFQDKVVLITGATSGIGKACAEAFAREGARVHFCGRREGEGMKLVQQMTQQRLIMSFSKADVKNENEVKAFAANCVAKYGQIDIAINNAGIYPQADFVAAPTSVHLDTLETNVNGVFFSMKYEIEQMLKQKDGGTIVNMASTSSHKAATFASASYCASKHAVLGLTKTAALMYAGKKFGSMPYRRPKSSHNAKLPLAQNKHSRHALRLSNEFPQVGFALLKRSSTQCFGLPRRSRLILTDTVSF